MSTDRDKRIPELEEATKLVKVDGAYRHYKSPDMLYRVMGFAIWEATDEIAVIYQAQYGEKLTFCRALSVWLEDVEFEGNKIPRFSLT